MLLVRWQGESIQGELETVALRWMDAPRPGVLRRPSLSGQRPTGAAALWLSQTYPTVANLRQMSRCYPRSRHDNVPPSALVGWS